MRNLVMPDLKKHLLQSRGRSDSSSSPRSVRESAVKREAHPETQEPARSSAAPRVERLLRDQPSPPYEVEHGAQPRPADDARTGWFRRHPIALAFGLFWLMPVGAAGYLYLDNARHYQSTDDAFIAARQFAIAPNADLAGGSAACACPAEGQARRGRPHRTLTCAVAHGWSGAAPCTIFHETVQISRLLAGEHNRNGELSPGDARTL